MKYNLIGLMYKKLLKLKKFEELTLRNIAQNKNTSKNPIFWSQPVPPNITKNPPGKFKNNC